MASELTYRGGAAPGSASDGGEYSPKPSKPLSWLTRAARYAAAEHRPVFALAGMLLAAALFSLYAPSASSSDASSGRAVSAAAATFSHLSSLPSSASSLHGSAGGKVPLGLRRRALRVLVTGGAGFVGSHLVDRLVERGDSVIVVDNFFTGRKDNVAHHLANPRFEVIRHDVVEPILLEVDQIYHLACPASPVHYNSPTARANLVDFLPNC
uniref:NAD-dependent epimerase/dehydratase domain-containing protein n=1 Tax=Oryza punctata TaxID=4537 RepID=A0A0E0JHR7_ORYPU